MIKKYIKGSILKGREVAKILHSLGAEDHYEKCFEESCLYFINSKSNRIDSVLADSFFGELIIQSFEEISYEEVFYKEIVLNQEDLQDQYKDLNIEQLTLHHFKGYGLADFMEQMQTADKITFVRGNYTRIFKNRS